MLDINLLRNDLAAVAAGARQARRHARRRTLRALEGGAQGHPGRARRSCSRRRNAASKQIGIAKAKGEDAAPLLARGRGAGRRGQAPRDASSSACRRELRDFLLDLPNIAHAEHARRRVGRRQRRGAPLGHAARVRLHAEGSRRPRRRPRAARLRHRGQALRRALLVPARRSRAPASRARAVHARHAHARARLHRVLHAVHRECGRARRHHAAAQVRGRHVRRAKGRRRRRWRAPVPHLHLGDHAHQHRARRDPRRRARCRSSSPRTRRASARRRAATARTRAA